MDSAERVPSERVGLNREFILGRDGHFFVVLVGTHIDEEVYLRGV